MTIGHAFHVGRFCSRFVVPPPFDWFSVDCWWFYYRIISRLQSSHNVHLPKILLFIFGKFEALTLSLAKPTIHFLQFLQYHTFGLGIFSYLHTIPVKPLVWALLVVTANHWITILFPAWTLLMSLVYPHILTSEQSQCASPNNSSVWMGWIWPTHNQGQFSQWQSTPWNQHNYFCNKYLMLNLIVISMIGF